MLEVLRQLCPYPTIGSDGVLRDGLSVKQPLQCQKCSSRSCKSRLGVAAAEPVVHSECDFGLSTLLLGSPFGPLLVNGVYVPFANTSLSPAEKKRLRPNKVTMEEIGAYAASLLASMPAVQRELDQRALDAIGGLHDIKTAVNLVFRNAEAIIRDLQGVDDDQKIEGAPSPIKGLLKSVSLLRSRLDMASIVANPEAARYGQPRRHPVYRICHRFVRLFEQEAQLRGVKIRMAGSSYNEPLLYDSFETIPLVLIDNAIKYSHQNSEVVVRVDDQPKNGCTVAVTSTGFLVPNSDRARIFTRGFRAAQARFAQSSGSGLGLFIAKLVADAHNVSLGYRAVPTADFSNDGDNVFYFSVSSIAGSAVA